MCIRDRDCAGPQYLERVAGDPGFGTTKPDSSGNEVMIQFGTGKVDFSAVYRKLKTYGFNGVIYVEGTISGDTVAATVANARANLSYLEKSLAQA